MPEQVRIFVIGGLTGQEDEDPSHLQEVAKTLGRHLGNDPSNTLVACSAHGSSMDAWVVQGFAETAKGPNRVIAHFPIDNRKEPVAPDQRIDAQWVRLAESIGLEKPRFRPNSEATVTVKEDFPEAFLLCQIRALIEDCDIVVALGGKPNASAAKLLAIARGGYPVVPFAFPVGSASQQEFQKQRAWLSQRFEDLNHLGLMDSLEDRQGVKQVLKLTQVIRRAHGQHRVFVSYPWKKRAEADYIEAFLRRDRRIEVFRDEESISIGESITDRINAYLQNCDVFVALWCAEYAASPNCYDEFHLALERNDCQIVVVRIDSTRPVWPKLRALDSLNWKGKWPQAEDFQTARGAITYSLEKLLAGLPQPRKRR